MSETDYLECLWFGGCNGVELLLWIYFSWLRLILPVLIASYVPATAWALMSLLPDYECRW